MAEGILNFGGLNLSGGITTVLVVALVILIVGLLIFIIWIARKLLKYKIKVVILERVGETFRVKFDKGALINKKGFIDFNLWSSRKNIPPPVAEDLLPNMNKGNTVFLYKFGENDYTSFRFDSSIVPNNPFKPVEIDMNNWLVLRLDRNKQQFGTKSFWDKWKDIIIPMTAFVFAFFIIFFVLQQMEKVSNSFNGAAQAIAQALKEFKQPPVPGAP